MSIRVRVLLVALSLGIVGGAACASPEPTSGDGPKPPPPDTASPPPATGQLTISPIADDGIGIEPGGGKTLLIATTGPTSFTGTVSLAVTSPVSGLTVEAQRSTMRGGVAIGEISVLATTAVAPGSYSLAVTASSPGLTSATRTVSVTVKALGAFVLSPYAISAQDTVAVAPGGEITLYPRVQRVGYPAPISIRAEGVPQGLEVVIPQATFDAQGIGTRLRAAANAVPGSYTFTWRASGPGLTDRTAVQRVNVRDFGSYSYRLTPDTIVAAPGQLVTAYLTLTKRQVGRFTISPLIDVLRTQPGITVDVRGSAQDSVPVLVRVAPGTPAGSYITSVRSQQLNLATQEHTIPVRVTSAAVASQTVSLDFSLCSSFESPDWVAYQDGNGAWRPASAVGNVYRFPISSSIGSYAIARLIQGSSSSMMLEVRTATRTELLAQSVVYCGSLNSFEQELGGTVTGAFSAFDQMLVTYGSLYDMVPGATVRGPPSTQSFSLIARGGVPRALVGWRSSAPGAGLSGVAAVDRGYIRRNAAPSSGRSFGNLDLSGPDAFDPIIADLRIGPYPANESLTLDMGYVTDPGCSAAPLYTAFAELSDKERVAARGVPPSRQLAGDLHRVRLTLTDNSGGFLLGRSRRSLNAYARLLTPESFVMPPLAQVTAVTSVPALYTRLSATVSLPLEYNRPVQFQYEGGGRLVLLTVDRGAIAGTNGVIALPDLSAVEGWKNSYAPGAGSTGSWSLIANGDNLAFAGGCSERTRVVQSLQQGRY